MYDIIDRIVFLFYLIYKWHVLFMICNIQTYQDFSFNFLDRVFIYIYIHFVLDVQMYLYIYIHDRMDVNIWYLEY